MLIPKRKLTARQTQDVKTDYISPLMDDFIREPHTYYIGDRGKIYLGASLDFYLSKSTYTQWSSGLPVTFNSIPFFGQTVETMRFLYYPSTTQYALHLWGDPSFGGRAPPNPADNNLFGLALYSDILAGDFNTWTEAEPGTTRCTGTATAGVGGNTLTDSAATFVTSGVTVGDIIQRTNTGTYGRVTAATDETHINTVCVDSWRTLSWATSDTYKITAPGTNTGTQIARRVGPHMSSVTATIYHSHKDALTDNTGGANIELYPDIFGTNVAGAGRVVINAFGQGSGTDANAIILRTRSGENAVTERMRIDDSGFKLASSVKVGFFGAAPVSQQTHIVDADGTAPDITTKFNALLAKLENYGLLASS